MKISLKKCLSLFLAMLMVLTCVPVVSLAAEAEVDPFSYGGCGPNATWVFDKDTGTLTISGTGEINGVEVDDETIVPYWYGYAGLITNAIIEEGITSIGDYAFQSCYALETITIPNSVTSIGESAFEYCESLTEITIPDGVTTIADDTFSDCSNLTKITIPDSVTNIGNFAFSGCSSLTEITIPTNVTTIGRYAFQNCSSLASITIPDGVTSISDWIFYGCSSFTEITIPNSVTNIDIGAFYGCSSLTAITIPNSVTSIDSQAFYSCSNLAEITIPDSVTSISSNVFDNTAYYNDEANWENNMLYIDDCLVDTSYNISNICEIKENTRLIADGVFDYYNIKEIIVPLNNKCYMSENGILFNKDKTTLINAPSTLTNYTIPESVTGIGEGAFQSCSNLTSITIPDSVTSIGGSAFCNCTALTKITMPDGVTTIGSYAFAYCSNLESIIIPDSVTSIGNSAFQECSNLASITMPDGVTEIGSGIFRGCRSLTAITIPDGVTNIDYGAFESCSNLKEIIIPDSITSIGSSAFSGCSSLTSITIPESVTKIGNGAFQYCSSLSSITIPNSVISIGDGAFQNCEKLTSIIMPNKAIMIEYKTFYNTGYYNNKENWENNILYIDNHLIAVNEDISGEVIIKDGVTTIPEDCFDSCSNLTSIIIPNSVTTIGDYAFYCCESLESIIIPDSVTEIGEWVFSECYNLQSVTLGKGITEINPNTFAMCMSLTDITIPANVTKIDALAFFYSGIENIYIENANTEINSFAFMYEEDGDVYPYFAIPNTATIHAPCVITEATSKENLTPYEYANKYLDSRFVSVDGNHDYTEWTTVTEPTIDAPGKEVRACVACEVKEERELTYAAVENVTVNVSDVVLKKGNTTTITATVTPENATNATLTYTSSDETVATVVDGIITAVGNGTAIITVSAAENPEVKATVNVKVSVPVTEFDVTVDVNEVVEGETATITTNIPSDDVTVTYESLTPEYATVDANGVITAVAPGEAVIKVTVTDAFGTVTEKTVTLTVKADFVPVTDINVTVNGEIKYVGDTLEVVAAVNPEATDKTFTFKASSNLIAREENGKIVITAIGEGVATLTITAGDYYETFTFGTVKAKPSVTIDAPTDVKLGDMGHIVVTPNIEGTYIIEYESSDESVVTVDDNGNIIATGAGTATVTAKVILEDGTVITKTVTVKSTDPNAGKLFCSFCDDYEKMKDGPVGFIYTIIHFIVHFVETIKFAT